MFAAVKSQLNLGPFTMTDRDHTSAHEAGGGIVVCQTSQGVEMRGGLLRLTRFLVVFELYSPSSILRVSEVFPNFKIIIRERTIYSGRAVIQNLVNAGLTVVCEATLSESSWTDIEFTPDTARNGMLQKEFSDFLREWQKLYRVLPEYKVIVADMQTFFTDLRLWLDQVELGIRTAPPADRLRLEEDVSNELAKPLIPCVDALFEKFERVAASVEDELKPAHRNYMRRQLHPLVLCSPFAHRTFYKPLGYAGDYDVVNMIVLNRPQGASLFAKIVDAWFLKQPPAQAHRNRIDYLEQKLAEEVVRVSTSGRETRVLNLACGPAQEVQHFLAKSIMSDQADFTLVDFNEETIRHARGALNKIKNSHNRRTPIQCFKKSVYQILKESGKESEHSGENQYDFIYCAGLLDYLPDQVCRRLTNTLYERLAPSGLLLATNVEPTNPLRNGMEYLLDWHLIYRTGPQMHELRPPQADAGDVHVHTDSTGLNVFLEVRRSNHA
jgi:extracellular factor (EF) 3-hydroxypalmitic acid methyl ester biosynthesis protein